MTPAATLSARSYDTTAHPRVTASTVLTRGGVMPEFHVEAGENPYYAVEVATSPPLLTAAFSHHRDPTTYFAGWETGQLATGPSYRLPLEVWRRLRYARRLYFRVWTSSDRDDWANPQVSTPDSEISTVPCFSLPRAPRSRGGARVTAPATVGREEGPPTFEVDPGTNAFYAIEVAADPDLFLESEAGLRDEGNYYATWRDHPLLAENPFVLPDASWEALSQQDRLWYRAWTTSSAEDWVDTDVTTPDSEIQDAPSLAIVDASPPDVEDGDDGDDGRPAIEDFVAVALSQRGDPYVFGAEASFDDADPDAFDCSELVQWAAFRAGVRIIDGAQNQRDACRTAGTLITTDVGFATRGALLFRIDEGPGHDHVAISLGDGTTIEARGSAFGVNVFSTQRRRWTHAGLVPGFRTAAGTAPPPVAPSPPGSRTLRRGDRGEDVRWAQRRLAVHGSDPGAADGIFGRRTEAAVKAVQEAEQLDVDGLVGPDTAEALRASD